MRLFLPAAVAAIVAAGPALAEDAALNKEGYWTVGRGEADAKGCLASVNIGDTAMLVVNVTEGQTDIAVGTRSAMRKGKQGVLVVGDQRFGFVPAYGEGKRDLMFMDGLDDGATAALRGARFASVMVDGREIVAAELANTGAADAMDAVVACSKGESGWWGPGVGVAAAAPAAPELVYRTEGDLWGIITQGAHCVAQAAAPDGRFLQLLSVSGRVGLAVGSNAGPLQRGRKARAETESDRFEFEPEYNDDRTYMNSVTLLEPAQTLALRRAKALRVTVDGRDLIDVAFEGDTFQAAVDAVSACSRGEKGWWGEGAKPAE